MRGDGGASGSRVVLFFVPSLPPSLPRSPLLQTRSQDSCTKPPPEVFKPNASVGEAVQAHRSKSSEAAAAAAASLAIPVRRRRARWCPRLAPLLPPCAPCDLARRGS